MKMILPASTEQSPYAGERGAALVTMLLISLLLLSAGGALILTTSMTATNSVDAAAETQAYYAAEAGNQAVLNVIRGNVAPNPLFVSNPSGGVDPQNKIGFRTAVTTSTSNVYGDTSAPRLSRWLSYDTTYTDRVTLTSAYTPMSGMAFNASISDPDNSAQVTFYTQGAFGAGAPANTATKSYGNGNTKVTVTFNQQTSTTINTSGNGTLGSFILSGIGSSSYTIPANETFGLTVVQTAPWPVTATINCTLSGTISTSSGNLTITFPGTNPANTNDLQGVLYTRFANLFNLPRDGTSTSIPVTITAPQPNRLIASITGFGPRNAKKQMQMLLSRFLFDLTTVSSVAFRSADDSTVLTFSAGNSAQYTYSGFDNAGGQNLSAFAVTSTPDYNYLTGLGLSGNQTMGSPSAIQQVSVSSLPSWLQTADGARALVAQLRSTAQNSNRYFTTANQPPDFGTSSQPVITFVDGDTDLPPAGGAGLLVVTGTLTLNGSSAFDGLVLVLGTGHLLRTGGGNGATLGSTFVASFGPSGNFLAPTFNSSGSGTSSIQYDSAWVRKALTAPGPRVLAVGEF